MQIYSGQRTMCSVCTYGPVRQDMVSLLYSLSPTEGAVLQPVLQPGFFNMGTHCPTTLYFWGHLEKFGVNVKNIYIRYIHTFIHTYIVINALEIINSVNRVLPSNRAVPDNR